MKKALLLALIMVVTALGAICEPLENALTAPAHTCKIIREFPHDPGAFTQGLVFHGGYLLEGTGLNGFSSLRRVDLKTGKVIKIKKLPHQYFGEGIAVHGGKIYQLTWRSRIGFVCDLKSFRQLEAFSYEGEGWGLTSDGKRLIMSDGSDSLRFLDPKSFQTTGVLKVRDGSKPVFLLNELEFVKGEIMANVLGSDFVACIAPETGQVRRWLDLRALRSRFQSRDADVLNGIAYDAKSGRLFVTGKKWPVLFEIKIENSPN